MLNLRLAVRQLAKTPGFTAVAAFTLALGLGANLTLFAVVDGILLRPLPFPNPDRLVAVFSSYPKLEVARAGTSFASLYGRQARIAAFSSIAAYKEDRGTVGEPEGARLVNLLRVSSGFFETLGAQTLIGRPFKEEEMTPATHHVAILSHDYWQQHCNSDPQILSRQIRLNGFTKQVVGVLPPRFRFLSAQPQILLPLSSTPSDRDINSLHDGVDCEMIARLKPNASLAEAQAQVDAHDEAISRDFPYAQQVQAAGFHTVIRPLHADHVQSVQPTLLLLQAGGALLLLIAGVNLSNLLLVRASSRSKEMAVRQSLGATPLHLIRQTITETVALALIGGFAGIVLGSIGVRSLSLFGVDRLPLGLGVTLDARVALAALVGALIVGCLIGIPVAWFNLRSPLAVALQSESRGGTSTHTAQRLRHTFAAIQVLLAFLLLNGTGLLAVSLKRTMEISPGFQPDHVLAGQISMLHRNYLDRETQLQFVNRAVEALRNQPGVQSAGIASNLPVGGRESGNQKRVMNVASPHSTSSALPLTPNIYGVAGDYFNALGVPLQTGRLFDPEEAQGNRRVCIVDETFARRNWPNANPLGQFVYDGPDVEPGEEPFSVIGIVGDVKQTELTETQSHGTIYFPFRNSPLEGDDLHVVIRTSQAPQSATTSLRQTLQAIEPELPLHRLQTMSNRVADSLIVRRSPLLLAGVFASTALLLAAVGTYGVLSFAVAQRRREIGVRMALGALPSQVGRHFFVFGLRLFAAGTILGIALSWLAGRAMQHLLYDVPPLHFSTLLTTTTVLGSVALIACLLPAWRASRIHPLDAIRDC